LEEFYKECSKKRSLGYLYVKKAYEAEKTLKENLEKAKKNFEESENYGIDAVLTKEQVSLVDYQQKIIKLIKAQKLAPDQEQEEILQVIGASFNETIYFCLLKAPKSEKFKDIGLKMKKEFNMPRRRYWWLKVRSLAELQDWKELEKFSEIDEGASPIGFVPFVDACLSWNNETQALKYIPKVENPKNKVDYYIGLSKPMFKEAIQAAAEVADLDLLDYISNKTENQKTKDTIQNVIDSITGGQQ
jgi:vacuolar protein sorting-associated protein 16